MRIQLRFLAAVWVGCLFLAAARDARAERFITLGPSDMFALGQPIVSFEVFEDLAGTRSFGPTDERRNLLLDTGANGILLDGGAYDALRARGYQTVSVYDESGVAGTTPMDVSEAYRLDFKSSDGQRFTIPDARIMSNEELNFGDAAGFYGLIGMPGMAGKIMSMGINGEWTSLSGEFSLSGLTPPVSFLPELPADTGHRYSIPLNMRDFEQSGLRDPDDPLPTWAPLPFTPVHVENAGQSFRGEMLVDTGAQMSVISMAMALALGVDENGDGSVDDEAIDFMQVTGVGGVTLMPVVQVGRLSVITDEGIEIGWTDLSVGVRDIDPSIAGIFGMNFFTEGWTDAVINDLICDLFPELCSGESPEGFIYDVHFDFRDIANKNGSMVFDLNPANDVVQGAVDGDTNSDGLVTIADLNNVRNNFGLSGEGVLGDTYPFNGVVDVDDLNAVRNHFGAGGASNAVPEPSGLVILVLLIASGIASRVKARSVALLFALGFVLGPSDALAAKPSFQWLGVTSIDTSATGVSGDGKVVIGHSHEKAFRWTRESGVEFLGDLPGGGELSYARGVSYDGSVIVGGSSSAAGGSEFSLRLEPFRWTEAEGMVGLGFLENTPPSEAYGDAMAVSADGSVIVGTIMDEMGNAVPYHWRPGQGMISLGRFASGSVCSAEAISAQGDVIAGVCNTSRGREAFRWTEVTGKVPGFLPGGELEGVDAFSGATGISDDGQLIVGVSHSTAGLESFRWTSGEGMIGLGDFHGGIYHSRAFDTSADGSIIVGIGYNGHEDQAAIWGRKHGPQSIHEILLKYGLEDAIDGGRLYIATGISSDGRTMVGIGGSRAGGLDGWIATVPEPSNWTLVGFSVAGLLIFTRRKNPSPFSAPATADES